jgi:hypothetical protein
MARECVGPNHGGVSRPERDDAGFDIAAAERNHSVHFGVPGAAKKTPKKTPVGFTGALEAAVRTV